MAIGRAGACLHCGKCCEWEVAKGLPMFADRRDEKREWCPHYDETKTTDHCRIQADKPEGCRLFPRVAQHLLPGCGFHFTEN